MNCQRSNQMKNTVYIMIVGVIAQLIFWSFLAPAVGATPQNIRGLNKIAELPEPIPCNPGTNGTSCVCPDKTRSDFTGCLKYQESTNGCHPINCWKWNKIKGQCEEAGKEWLPGMILQCIPFTGVFGSGFGNVGRWDIFGTYMTIIFGGCLATCCCGCICNFMHKEEEKAAATKGGSKCCSCLISVAILVMYIWGIVVMANKEIEAPWTDYLGNPIMCPLI